MKEFIVEEQLIKIAENCYLKASERLSEAVRVLASADAQILDITKYIQYLGNDFLGFEEITSYNFIIKNELYVTIRVRFAYNQYQSCSIETENKNNKENKKFYNQCKALGIVEEVIGIINNCECFDEKEEIKYSLHILSKTRKRNIKEVLGDYFGIYDYECHMSTFCKKIGIKESEIGHYYALAICNDGYEIAYEINNDVVLILE